MKQSQVIKKLNRAVETKRAKLRKEMRRDKARAKRAKGRDDKSMYLRWADESANQLKRLNYRTISGLTYGVKANYFSNSRGTTGFNPETFEGHSYGWWAMTKKIKGVVVLNTYRYSSQTSIHIGRCGRVLRDLGIKYKTLDAPRGLQDLDSAVAYELDTMAERLVRDKYSRGNKKPAAYYVEKMRTFMTPELKLLKSFNYGTNQKMRDMALERAENDRLARNERNRERAKYRRELAAIKIVVDVNNKRTKEVGYHVVHDRAWSWNEQNEFVGSVSDYERRSAHSKGFKTIIVHKTEPRHLEVVS